MGESKEKGSKMQQHHASCDCVISCAPPPRLSLPHAEEDAAAAQEPQASDETDNGENGRGPEQALEEIGGTLVGARLCPC